MTVGLASYVLLTVLSLKLLGFHAIVPSLVFGLLAFLLANKIGEKQLNNKINKIGNEYALGTNSN